MGLLEQMLPSLGSGLLLGVLLVPPAAILLGLTVLTGRRKRPSRVDTIRPSEERVLILGASGASFFFADERLEPGRTGYSRRVRARGRREGAYPRRRRAADKSRPVLADGIGKELALAYARRGASM